MADRKEKLPYIIWQLLQCTSEAEIQAVIGVGGGSYTNEDAQDAVGGILTDTATINFTYNDAGNIIQAAVIDNSSLQKVEIVKNGAAVIGARKQLNFIEGTNVALTIADDAGNDQVDITIEAAGGGGANIGTALLNFGAFPGASDASIAVTGQAGILSSSIVEAWLTPVATANHTADEHLLETLKVMAGNIVPGTGFTIYGFNTNQINEPLLPIKGVTGTLAGQLSAPAAWLLPAAGGRGTRLYGEWTVAWRWS